MKFNHDTPVPSCLSLPKAWFGCGATCAALTMPRFIMLSRKVTVFIALSFSTMKFLPRYRTRTAM
jgi:hypothetical protein